MHKICILQKLALFLLHNNLINISFSRAMYTIAGRTVQGSRSNILYHIEAILISAIWGITFVSTKVLMSSGLGPEEIMLLRFVLAYIFIWTISPRKLWANKLKDELLMLVLGIVGGSFYFLAENIALQYIQASDVSILLSIIPLLSALVAPLFFKTEKITKPLIIGAVVALAGVGFVVMNEHVALHPNPIGDVLVVGASMMWVAYGIIIKKLGKGYSSVFITRKVFFYGILTIIPAFPIMGTGLHLEALISLKVILNLLFLGLIASYWCFLSWNKVIDRLGIVTSNNYLYLSPLATFVFSAIVLNETITFEAIVGASLILVGVFLAQKK